MKLSKIFYIAITALVLTGCQKKQQQEEKPVQIEEKQTDHKWFYFSEGSYRETDLPQHSPILSLKPWTESVRICDGNVTSDGQGILLVNHFGIMVLNGEAEPRLIQDYQLFSESTAGNLVFEDSIPFFTLAKNSFFNKKAAAKNSLDTSHVIRFSPENNMLFPAVTYGDLKIEDYAEVSGTYYDGKNWFTSIKGKESEKTYFRYISWKPAGELSSLQPLTMPGKILIEEIDEETYRKNSAPLPFGKAPARIKTLLSSIPSDFAFNLTCRDIEGHSPRYFYSGKSDDSDFETAANAIITPEWVCAVFGDGTAYFRGSLKGRQLANKGKTVAFRLPKLPKTYVYGDFCISGDYMTIAWEENDFYKTGRSGFLTVNMQNLFYQDKK